LGKTVGYLTFTLERVADCYRQLFAGGSTVFSIEGMQEQTAETGRKFVFFTPLFAPPVYKTSIKY